MVRYGIGLRTCPTTNDGLLATFAFGGLPAAVALIVKTNVSYDR